MRNRLWAVTGAAIALSGLAGALSGCSSPAGSGGLVNSPPKMSAPSSNPATSSPAGRAGGGPNTPVVELNNGFSPRTLQLGTGQQFELNIGKNVKVSGLNVAGCTASKPTLLPGGLLSVRCQSATDYMYSAERAGTATLSATVRPNCAAGTMCPQWMARPTLRVTIS